MSKVYDRDAKDITTALGISDENKEDIISNVKEIVKSAIFDEEQLNMVDLFIQANNYEKTEEKLFFFYVCMRKLNQFNAFNENE